MNIAVGADATALFRSAYENRYTWAPEFPGYSADVTYRHGDVTFAGSALVSPDPRMGYKGEITGIDNEDVAKIVSGQLWEIAIHRVRRPFEKTHAGNSFSFGETKANGAVEVLMGGKSAGDRYEVCNNEVSLVHRNIHGSYVTIHTFTSHDTGEGYLSHTYDSQYSDPATGELKGGKSVFEDTYTQVGGYQILNSRTIKTDEGTMEFTFSNIQLLGN
jgi:hypothetical protein